MSGLPPALAPWAAPLAPFAQDLALVLGEWARRVAPLLGPIPRRRSALGDPDGLSGLARRGRYERLLLSEWLLADELPDEFVRRAAASEHLFLAHGRRRGGAGLRSVALFDAGPEQVGAPRIAQLATLVVLAARAEAAGAELLWGVVQDPAARLASGFSAELARRFLGARTRTPAGEAALQPWLDLVAAAGPHDDAWLVGGALLAGSPAFPRALRLHVEEVADPRVRQVRLALSAQGARRREVLLDLPVPADCTRLVRDPFRAAEVEPARLPGRVIAGAGVLFSQNGRRGAVRVEGATLLDFPVPNSPRGTPGRRRTVPASAGLLAVGWARGKHLLTASTGGGEVRITRGKDPQLAVRCTFGRGVPPASAPAPAERPGSVLFTRGQVWLLDGAGVLYNGAVREADAGASAELWVASVGVSSLLTLGNRVVYLARRGQGLELVMQAPAGRTAQPLGDARRAFLARGAGGRLLAAVEETPGGTWAVWCGEVASLPLAAPPRLLRPPSDTEVIGVTEVGGEAALVLLEDDRRDFTLLSAKGLKLAFGAVARVASVSLAPATPVVAYATSAGALHLWSMERGEPLLTLVPGGAP